MNQKQRMERGITLIEMAIALMLVAVAVAGIVTWMSSINQQLQLRGDAKHFSSVAKAAQLYLKGERGELIKEANTGTTSKWVPIDDLKSKGYLAKEIQNLLGKKQQEMHLLIKLDKVGHNVDIRGLLITDGGADYTNDELGNMVSMAGISAGYIRKDGEPVEGISGSWKADPSEWNIANIKPTPAHLVALLTDTLTSALNRVTPPYLLNDFDWNRPMANSTGRYIQISMLINCPWSSWADHWGRVTFWVIGKNGERVRVAMAGKHRGNGNQQSVSFIVPPNSIWSGDFNKHNGGGSRGCYIVHPDGSFDSESGNYVVTELG